MISHGPPQPTPESEPLTELAEIGPKSSISLGTAGTLVVAVIAFLGYLRSWEVTDARWKAGVDDHLSEIDRDLEAFGQKFDGVASEVARNRLNRWDRTDQRLWAELLDAKNPDLEVSIPIVLLDDGRDRAFRHRKTNKHADGISERAEAEDSP